MESKTRRFWIGLGMAHTSLTFVYPQRQPGDPVKTQLTQHQKISLPMLPVQQRIFFLHLLLQI